MDAALQDALGVARASYQRAASPEFFDAFYKRLFELRPDTRPLFVKTEFDRQHKLLRHRSKSTRLNSSHIQKSRMPSSA